MDEFLEKLRDGLDKYEDFNKIYDSLNILFKYELKDAWGMPIKSLYLTNDGFLYLLGDENKVLNVNIDKVKSLLERYYGSKNWFHDKDAYENQEISNIKAGVLSEDAVWDLLEEMDETILKMKKIVSYYEKKKKDRK